REPRISSTLVIATPFCVAELASGLRLLRGPAQQLVHGGSPSSESGSCSTDLFSGDAPVLAGSGSCRQREQGVSGGAPAAPGPLQMGVRDDALVGVVSGEGVLAAPPVPAGSAKDAHGGGVAAALGGEVAAVAEHVRPAAQCPEVLVRVAA